MVKPPKNLQAFKQALEKEKISLVIRQNDNGIIYGLTYIDHNTKCVFNGSDIGKDYSAKAILEKCGVSQTIPVRKNLIERKSRPLNCLLIQLNNCSKIRSLSKIMDAIIKPSEGLSIFTLELKKQKKKKAKISTIILNANMMQTRKMIKVSR